MCDFFWQRSMDGGGGDLVDIIHSAGSHRNEVAAGDTWQFPTDADEPFQTFSTDDLAASYADAFDLWDPPLNELVGTSFSVCGPDMSYDGSCGGDGGGSIQNSKNIFSRVVQILPVEHSTLTRRMTRPFPMVTDHGVHTSSPRAPGIKKRKNPVKKVVCIPAPTAANSSRPSSAEVVPSDLWAWRKYGQKPIKGSPYPRGYYRCSSSKGCLARKQVERSRSDPNMLVITYTSEHNHPWPTQRNSLAGSTRSSNPPKNHKITTAPKISNLKCDHINTTSSSILTTKVKEELIASDHDIFDKLVLLESNHQCDDFFADLLEIENGPYGGVDPFVNMFDWEHLS